MRKGSNNFNQDKIATQYTYLTSPDKPTPKQGMMEWDFDENTGAKTGVIFVENPEGKVFLIEKPEVSKDKRPYENLYISGIDSIDMGLSDTVGKESEQSKLVCLVKKRLLEGQIMTSKSNMYVAWYEGRSNDVRDDYDQVMMLNLYFNARANLEFTKINIVQHFRNKGFYHLFMKRPVSSTTDVSGGKRKNNLIGTLATGRVIDLQDELISDYINDSFRDIFILPLINQLRDYIREDRTKYDFVIAMGLCEIADSDMYQTKARVKPKPILDEMSMFGYYRDKDGRKLYGEIPKNQQEDMFKDRVVTQTKHIRFMDEEGNPRFDEDYYDSTRNNDDVIDEFGESKPLF